MNPKEFHELLSLKIDTIHPVFFYINTNENIIWDRLIKRKDNIDEAQRRIIADREDFSDIEQNVDFVFKNNGELKPRVLADMIKYSYDKCMNTFINKR